MHPQHPVRQYSQLYCCVITFSKRSEINGRPGEVYVRCKVENPHHFYTYPLSIDSFTLQKHHNSPAVSIQFNYGYRIYAGMGQVRESNNMSMRRPLDRRRHVIHLIDDTEAAGDAFDVTNMHVRVGSIFAPDHMRFPLRECSSFSPLPILPGREFRTLIS